MEGEGVGEMHKAAAPPTGEKTNYIRLTQTGEVLFLKLSPVSE